MTRTLIGFRLPALLLSAALCLTLAACDDATTPPSDAGPPTDDAGPTAASVMITGSISAFGIGGPVVGAQVCVFDHPEVSCATSDATGSFNFTTTLRGPIALDVTQADHMPTLAHLEVGAAGGSFTGLPMIPDVVAGPAFEMTGAPADPARGHLASGVRFSEDQRPAVGAVVTLDTDEGIGPVYFSAGAPDPALTALEDESFNAINLPAGEVVVSVSHPSADCVRPAGASWAGPTPNSARLRIEPGYLSVSGSFSCTRTSPPEVLREHEGHLANAAPSECRTSGQFAYSFDEEAGWWNTSQLSADNREVVVDQVEYLLVDDFEGGTAAAEGCSLLDHRVRLFVGSDDKPEDPTFVFETEITGVTREAGVTGSIPVVVDVPPITLAAGQSLYVMVETPVVGGERICMPLCGSFGLEAGRNAQSGAAEAPYTWPTLTSFGIANQTYAMWARIAE